MFRGVPVGFGWCLIGLIHFLILVGKAIDVRIYDTLTA